MVVVVAVVPLVPAVVAVVGVEPVPPREDTIVPSLANVAVVVVVSAPRDSKEPVADLSPAPKLLPSTFFSLYSSS